MNLRTALRQGTEILEKSLVAAPRLTAEVLLSFAIHRPREHLYAHPEQELEEVEWLHFGRYMHERMEGKPTQYITHRQEFYGREFRVTADVLIPRPETEHVVEAALRLRPGPGCIVDIGAGSGALAVTLQLETGARVVATDISPGAMGVAAENARSLSAQIDCVVCDVMEALAPQSADWVVSNPPYVPVAHKDGLQREVRDWEPHVALFAGVSGFEIYDRIVADAPRVLRAGGWLILELGFGSLDHVRSLLASWREIAVTPDLAGIPRVISARRG